MQQICLEWSLLSFIIDLPADFEWEAVSNLDDIGSPTKGWERDITVHGLHTHPFIIKNHW